MTQSLFKQWNDWRAQPPSEDNPPPSDRDAMFWNGEAWDYKDIDWDANPEPKPRKAISNRPPSKRRKTTRKSRVEVLHKFNDIADADLRRSPLCRVEVEDAGFPLTCYNPTTSACECGVKRCSQHALIGNLTVPHPESYVQTQPHNMVSVRDRTSGRLCGSEITKSGLTCYNIVDWYCDSLDCGCGTASCEDCYGESSPTTSYNASWDGLEADPKDLQERLNHTRKLLEDSQDLVQATYERGVKDGLEQAAERAQGLI